MENSDLNQAWASLQTHLERTQRLNDLLVAQSMMKQAQTPLTREKRALAIEIVVNYAGVVGLGSFAAGNASRPDVLISAAILAASLIAINIALISIALAISDLDYEEPVVAIQAQLERLKMRRAGLTAIILIAGPLLWVPLFVVLLGLAGIDALQVLGIPYLAANAALGITIAAAAMLWARRYGSGFLRSRWGRRAADALSGQSYREAAEFLDTIERFSSAA